ncbi:uncharacterized protein [Periplaneta americana]|uniref:uncharacterized protein n=1 Tax=Periplaneta americana TaxID=6978 RepID=UPI0037E96DC2
MQKVEAPEGGWGWMVASGLAVVYIVVYGPFGCVGLLLNDLLESLGEGTQTLTLIGSVFTSFSLLLGVVTNFSLTNYTCRQVAVVGAIFVFLGNFITVFANSTTVLIISYGVLQGTGLGLLNPAIMTSFNRYFIIRRTFAMGITQLVIGIGSMVVPLLFEILFEEYGFRGTQAVITAFSLHTLYSAVVQHPVEKHCTYRKGNIEDKQKLNAVEDYLYEKQSLDSDMKQVHVKSDTNNSFYKQEKRGLNDQNSSCDQEEFSDKGDTVSDNVVRETDAIMIDKLGIGNEFVVFNILETNHQSSLSYKRGVNLRIPVENFEGTKMFDSDVNKPSHIIVTDSETDHIAYSYQYSQEDESAEEHLLREDGLKVCYTPDCASTDLGSFRTGNPVSISDSRATVTSLGSWTSSYERGRTKSEKMLDPIRDDEPGSPIKCSRFLSAVVNALDLSLLLEPVFVNIAIGISVAFFADMISATLFPLIFLSLGYSNADAALSIFILNAGDIAGRLCITVIGALCPQITSRSLLLAGSIGSVIGRIFLVSFQDFTVLAVIMTFIGFNRSFVRVLLLLVMAEYDLKRFPAAFGLSSVMGGITILVGGPIIGKVRDVTNSYPICINTINAIHFTTCILPWVLELAILRCRASSKAKEAA